MTSSILITPEEALRVIAEDPESLDKTPTDLEKAAEEFEHKAERKDRIAAGANGSNRAKARAKSRERKGDRLRLHAQVMRKTLGMQDGGES